MTLRKFKLKIDGLFEASGEIDLSDTMLQLIASKLEINSPDIQEVKTVFKPGVAASLGAGIFQKPKEFTNILDLGVAPIDSQIEGLRYRGCYYPGQAEPKGDGYWITFDQSVKIIKVKHGIKSVEPAKSYIGQPDFLTKDLSKTNLFIPDGTYLLYQANGVNPLWYQQFAMLFGSGTLIGIKNDSTPGFNKIVSKVHGIKLINILIDNVPSSSRDQIFEQVSFHLGALEKSRNPITLDHLDASLEVKDLQIHSDANLRAGIFIEKAKNVEINGAHIEAAYADNGVRISQVLEKCIIQGVTTGKGFNTGIQASSNRKSISKGLQLIDNQIIDVIEEGLGYDSYANNLGLLPVICKSYVSKAQKHGNEYQVELDSLWFIEQQAGGGYGEKRVQADFVGDPTRFLLVVESGPFEYFYSEISSFETFNSGQSLKLGLKSKKLDLAPGTEVALVSGFYQCTISGSKIKGLPNNQGKPGHGLSLWGGGFDNLISDNVVTGGNSGLNLVGLGAFGVNGYFCHSIGNKVINNEFNGCEIAFHIKTEYSHKYGFEQVFSDNKTSGGTFLINKQRNFTMKGNVLKENRGLIEDVSGVFEGGRLVDTVIEIKNCPNLKIGQIEMVGNSKIIQI
ncbi:hypothetical protein [Algoriphagus confluentis]|uniref:Right-handed parallel beta-helix repeat-containing protein n=1 Tax=Algoriphagus confluentis TaxID=1697556 RepID=A0ABQ6PVG7_9BACT|nr:hypothetical protein Aconfl_42660 [Algoriphagus confluentis]